MISSREHPAVLPASETVGVQSTKTGRGSRFLLLFAFLFFAAAGIWGLTPPSAVSSGAAATEFSSGRAMNHVRAMAQTPHPIGSKEHEQVRAYIVGELAAQGLEPEVQEATAVTGRGVQVGATVHNVLARLKGQSNSRAVLLSAHYDSVAHAPGAGDDAAGVAALLETLRALKAGPPLKNDVVLLFTDGEEVGMQGARALVKDHPWAKDVGVALNFEARGTGGPAFMFETTPGNGRLIESLANAVDHPTAASYMYDIYKRLPNDSDLTVFREAGIAGLNFAFINDAASFHTRVDDIQSLDERGLQHHGLYALGLTRELGNIDLTDTRVGDAVYFDLLGFTLVHYPARAVIPIAIFVGLPFIAIVVIGMRNRRITARGYALGVAAFLSSILAVAVVVEIAKRVVLSAPLEINSASRSNGVVLFGFVALTFAVVAAIYGVFARTASAPDLAVGALFCWFLLMMAAALYWPGASYLFVWPLLFSLFPPGWLVLSRKDCWGSTGYNVVLAACTIPGIILIVPTVYALYIGVGLAEPTVLMLLLTLLLGMLMPHLGFLTIRIDGFKANTRRATVLATGLCAVVLMCAGATSGGYSANRPKPNSLFYGLNADTGAAVWASMDKAADPWTSRFIAPGTAKGHLNEFFPLGPEVRSSPADASSLPPPSITAVEKTDSGGVRTVRLLITSPRKASTIELVAENQGLTSARLNGKELVPGKTVLRLRYFGLPQEGIELVVAMNSTEPVSIRIADYKTGLAELNDPSVQERPADFMPSPRLSWMQDSVAVSKVYTF